jgi:uncharacterized OB-fold protein
MTGALSPPIPRPDPDSQAWWDSLRDGVYAISYCESCATFQHPPTEACRICGDRLVLRPVAGAGTVYSFIIQRRAMLPGFEVPYVLALVELDDQPGLKVTGKVDCPIEDAAIGMQVTARIEEIGDSGFFAPVFAPTG